MVADTPDNSQDDLADEWARALGEAGVEDADTGGAPKPKEPGLDLDLGTGLFLDQEEVDTIFGFDPEDADQSKQNGVRAIVDSTVVSYERLPMLEIVFDRLVRTLTTTLRSFFSDNVEVSLDDVTSVRFGDYVSSLPLPTILAVFKAEPWENYGLITIDSDLIYLVMDVLLGGRRGLSNFRIEGRPYTTVEVNLVRRLLDLVLGEAEQAFQPLSPVKFIPERIETNPRFASITRPANAAILIALAIDLEGRGGRVEILLPYATIEPIRELLLQSYMGEKLGRDHIWEGHLASEIWQATLDLDAVLHETSMPVSKVLELQVGDTLVFDVRGDPMVTVRCGDLMVTQGKIGRIGDHMAIQIAKPLRRSRTTLAAFEQGVSVRRDR
ncbi:MAG: flagellar motor switch protein FliM [Methylobacterium sp.]|nr:MAG: flagellar motor switch protein FliM [Methylobacterium sp.]